jgi:hypothetical protein
MDSPGQTITFNIPPHGDFEHSFTYVITVNNTQLIDLSDDWIKIWNKLTKTNNDQYKHRKLEINSQCPITLDDIKNGDKYMICHTCNNIFSYDALIDWLETNNTCPLCRSSWNDTNVYINKQKYIPKNVVDYNKMSNNNHHINNKLQKKIDRQTYKQQSYVSRRNNRQFNNYR